MAAEETTQVVAGEDQAAPDVEQSEVLPFAHGAAATYTARCPSRETPNEDMGAVIPVDDKRAILAVADGMGGPPGGAQAASIAIDTLIETVNKAEVGEDGLRPIILNAFEAANERVLELGIGSGTTLAVVEIDGVTMRPYHAGDSVILIVGQRGKVKLQTVAHSPVGYAVESGLLDAGEAIHHEDRHIVSNIVGSPHMWIEIGPPRELAARDTVVLGSDGLFDNLHVEEVIELVRRGPLDQAAKIVAKLARGRMVLPEPGHPSKPDDLTFILYRRSRGRA
ncbi:MAG: serine/threonine-protein phosphatase [Phycisphaerales bacterium]|nr:MAG: serine/threonine-protein phosphatase [Phycisphaerales bacterium]